MGTTTKGIVTAVIPITHANITTGFVSASRLKPKNEYFPAFIAFLKIC